MSSVTQSSDFLAGIGTRDREEILASATVRRFKAKEAIVTRGEPAKHLFMLRHGRVRYYKITKRGIEIVFRWLVPGDIFGLGTLLPHPSPYMGTAETLNDSEVLVWTHASMRKHLEAIPQIAENALRVVLHYLRAYADRHTRLVSKSAEERVADVLLILGHQQGQLHDRRIEVEITNEQLSALADTSLFTTSRIMSQWARKGYISKQRGRVLITEPEALVTD
jgi:CRP/FNR family transcriptional regulator, nitrogen oxide reductase regulator